MMNCPSYPLQSQRNVSFPTYPIRLKIAYAINLEYYSTYFMASNILLT